MTKSIIISRLEKLDKLNKSKELQAIAMSACKADPILWCNEFVWTYDPRVKPSTIPFILYPIQEDYIKWRLERIKKRESGAILKSRDMGLSWLNVMHETHMFLFDEGHKGTFSSRKEALVDKIGNIDSIFEKIRAILRTLPRWMLPKDFDWKLHDNFCKIINPNNGSVLTGEVGSNSGRGGRSSIYEWDEVAFTDQALTIDRAISQNADIIFYTSTPNGIGGVYYDKIHSGNIPVFRAHWLDDPRKNHYEIRNEEGEVITTGQGETKDKRAIYPWYENQKLKSDEVTLAQEVDLRFDISAENVFISGDIIKTAVDLVDLEPRLLDTGDLTVSPHHPNYNKTAKIPRVKIAALDVATTGKNLSVLGCRQGSVVQWFKDWKNNDPTQLAYKVVEVWEGLPVEERWHRLIIDADGVGAGTLSTLNAIPDLKFDLVAFRGGARPSSTYYEAEEKYAYEKYHNARAESWGIVKYRLKNTYDHVMGVKEADPEVMISIPDNPKLISQLSAPMYKYTNQRKILLESKEDMSNRGVASPDYADCLAYMFSEVAGESDWLNVL